jgi:uncharacterized protein (TIGR02466 family)
MIENIFPTPIYCHKASFDEIFLVQDEIKKAMPTILENDTFGKPDGWEDEIKTNIIYRWNTIKDYNLINLTNYIEKHLLIYMSEVQPFIEHDLKLMHSWLNITEKGMSQEWHSHSDSTVSGVYYYQTNGDDGNFLIRNPSPFAQTGLFPAGTTVPEKIIYKPIVGTLLLFPGWLDHRVCVNTTDDARISLAFNFLPVYEEPKGLIT